MTTGPLAPGPYERVSCVWKGVPLHEAIDIEVRVEPEGSLLQCRRGNERAIIRGAECPPIL